MSCLKRRLARLLPLMLALVLLHASRSNAAPVPVRHKEGISHGFLLLRSLQGELLASGDLIQVVRDDWVTSELVFHFKDGSIHDETTIYSQHDTFRLVTDHLIQKGPAFPHPVEVSIDAQNGTVTVRSMEDRKNKVETKHLDIPEDAANGMILTLLKNIPASAPAATVSMVTTSSKPRVVKLAISASGRPLFNVGGSARRAIDYDVKVEIGGIAGAVAHLIGKQPPDTHVWIFGGRAPTFLRFEGVLYEGGPIWRIDPADIVWSDKRTGEPDTAKKP
jgi:hypothetical protein